MPIFGMGAGRDSVSVAVAGIFNSKAAIRTESMHNMIGAHASANTIYSKVAEYFLIARFRPKDVSLDDLTDVCENLVSRSPCTYLGGIYLFFAGLSALLVYENYVIQALGGELPSRGKDLNKSIVILEVDDNDLSNLHSTISAITEAVAGEARKNPVLLCFYRALCSRHFRIRGLVDEALQFALFDPNSDSVQVAASVPLGFAFLKMEMALCLLASHDETLPLASKRDNLSEAILIAKESQQLLAKFEAEIEIATLKQCIVDCEDLMRHMLPSFYSSKHNATMSARAYWLDLAGDEDSQDEEER